jgi:hypothetical protein
VENGAFSEKSFKDFAKDVVLFCHITSQVDDEPDPELLREKSGRMAWPHLVFMDAEGDVLTQGERSVEGLQKTLGSLNDVIKLEKLAKKGDKSAETPLFIAKVRLARYNFAEASAKRKKLPSESKAQKAEIDKLIIGLEADAITSKINRRRPDPTTEEAVGKKLAAMHKAGRIPEGNGAFWVYLMKHAFKNENVALAEEAFEGVKKAHGKNIRKSWVNRTQEQLDDLKEKVKESKKGNDK